MRIEKMSGNGSSQVFAPPGLKRQVKQANETTTEFEGRMLQGRFFLTGSDAIAEAVRLCRPDGIAAYPITPQTLIVERLSQMHADGKLGSCSFENIESELGAASFVIGVSAAGGRAYTASASQGILLMISELYSAASSRFPVVLTIANRALSAPLSILNDHQDAMAIRDTGFIMLFAENNQEAVDLHLQAFKIAEKTGLPVAVCVDGFLITHTAEGVLIPSQEEVDKFLPPRDSRVKLDTKKPVTLGAYAADSQHYIASRLMLQRDVRRALGTITETAAEFRSVFGRQSGGLIESHNLNDASIALVGMGSMIQVMRGAAASFGQEDEKVGVLNVRSFRPFPSEEIKNALDGVGRVVVVEKALSFGAANGTLATEVRDALYGKNAPPVDSFIAGLGGTPVTEETIREAIRLSSEAPPAGHRMRFLGVNMSMIPP